MRWSYKGLQDKDETFKPAGGNEQNGETVAGTEGCCVLSDGEWRERVPSEAVRKEILAREKRYLKDKRYG